MGAPPRDDRVLPLARDRPDPWRRLPAGDGAGGVGLVRDVAAPIWHDWYRRGARAGDRDRRIRLPDVSAARRIDRVACPALPRRMADDRGDLPSRRRGAENG